MAQQQEEPIYWDRHASRWNITLIFALIVAAFGFFSGFVLTALGLAMAVFSWITTPRQYLLYRDHMVIVYGTPRTRVISFAEISHIETLALPFGERLRLRMVAGNRMMLMMRDPSAFMSHLEDALARYHGEQTGQSPYDSAPAVPATPGGANWEPADDPGAEGEPYAGRLDDAPAAATSGSYYETDDPPAPAPERYPDPAEDPPNPSGSYTETPAPDYSGEGRSTYGAEVELDTSRPDEPERPPSPY